MKKQLTEDELIAAYNVVFSQTHSNGFKTSEIKDLLFDETYWFNESPNENWYKNLIDYLNSIQFDIDLLKINPHFTKNEK